MNTRTKTLGHWLLAVAIIVIAFVAGASLREQQYEMSAPVANSSVQANALLKLTPEWSPVALKDSTQQPNENRDLVSSIVKLLKTHYVEPITAERQTQLAHGAVQGMLASLDDPDTRFLDPKERKLLDEAGSGKFSGIGAVVGLRNEKIGELDVTKVVVIAPMPGSPAEKAGLRPGDSITYIGGKWIITNDPFKEANLEKLAKAARNKEIDEFTYQKAYDAAFKRLKEGIVITDALETLTAKSSGEVSIRVDRPGEAKPIDFKLTCGSTVVDPVTARMLKNGMAYIHISQFNRRAVKEFAEELKGAQSKHAKALILDLRSNPGGLMDAAVEVVGKIAGGGVMATVQETKRSRTVKIPAGQKLRLPVVVLVNGGTASVAELTAGDLKENGIATLVGTRTFGDGLAQTPLILKDGSAAVLTTGKMLTAKGTDFNGKGIQPDKTIVNEGRGDKQLEEAEKVLAAKLGRA